MKTGLLFGTFNPIHNGHLAIANYMANNADLNEIWFIVSPQNPLKKMNELLNDKIRFELVKIAIKKYPKLKADDAEFLLSKPSYTINTLEFLKKKHPEKKFVLIIGEDNLRNFQQWKNFREILEDFQIYVYPRKTAGNKKEISSPKIIHPNIRKFDSALMDISATAIRRAIKNGENVSAFLPEDVYKEIKTHKYYA